ncbi:hypothetical protein [Streptomyces sp. NPDC002088]|uniref:hypothetical protein n=1 Tax=Streptomyces sp. NPDC002088 TaxID=3154665 RepID=UPI0033174740
MATDEEIVQELAAHMVERGWSRPKAAVQSRMWFDFLAPRIRAQAEEVEGKEDCPKCRSTTLHDLLGHDALGHKTANSLTDKGVRTPEGLVGKGLEWVLDFTSVGTKGVDRIKERLSKDDYQRFADTRWSA